MNARQQLSIYVGAYLVYFVLVVASMGLMNGSQGSGLRLFIPGASGWIEVAALAVLLGWPVLLMMYLFRRPPAWRRDVQRTGRLAEAQILWVKDTGISGRGDGSFYIDLKVQVMPQEELPFEADLQLLASRLGASTLGEVIMVRYDPANHRRVAPASDWRAADAAPARETNLPWLTKIISSGRVGVLADRLHELEAMHHAGALSELEFRVERKKLLA